jgi:hypothetical protein
MLQWMGARASTVPIDQCREDVDHPGRRDVWEDLASIDVCTADGFRRTVLLGATALAAIPIGIFHGYVAAITPEHHLRVGLLIVAVDIARNRWDGDTL